MLECRLSFSITAISFCLVRCCSRSLNKDVGVNLMHVLNDGLWRYTAKEAAGAATNSDGSDDD